MNPIYTECSCNSGEGVGHGSDFEFVLLLQVSYREEGAELLRKVRLSHLDFYCLTDYNYSQMAIMAREGEMEAVGVPITVYLETQVLSGLVYPPVGKRLSDLLNSVGAGQSENSGKFLECSDLTISHADGTRERTQTAYINKSTIQIVATPDRDSARGIGARVGPKTYPFVQKTPVRVRTRLPGYEVTGSMHCASGQRVWQLLEEEKLMFLPLTSARICTSKEGVWWTAAFVSINREQILSLQHEVVSMSS